MLQATRNLIRFLRDPIGMLKELSQQGDRVSFYLASHKILFLNDPALIKEVLIIRQKAFGRGDVFKRMKMRILGPSLLTDESAGHTRSRRLIQPVFHPHRLEVYAQCMLQAASNLANSWKNGQEVNISAAMNEVTLHAVGASLFGPSMMRSSGELFKALDDLLSIQFPLYGHPLEPMLAKYPRLSKLGRAVQRLDKLIYPLIEERRASPTPSDDLLTMLIKAHEDELGSFDDRQVRNETLTLLLAGHETTAILLGWAIYLLSENASLQDELGLESQSLSEFGWESLANLPKLGQFLDEVLRLRPPGWVLERFTLEPVEIGNEVVEAGTTVLASQYIMHRDPRFWEEPEKVKLDRWGPGAKKKAQEAFTYFPFGAGARMCIGEHFSRAEALLVLASLLKKWRFRVLDSVSLSPQVTLHPTAPIRAVVTSA